MIAIDFDSWNYPGLNVAFLASFFGTFAGAGLVVWYGKRRPVGALFSWGEAMLGATYMFGLLFLAFGIVPHQWIDHADKDLGWNKTKILYGPFDILKPQAAGGNFPMTLQYEAIRDVIVVVIHLWFFGLIIYLWAMWQNRGKKAAAASKEIATSAFGRPLVKKA